MEKSTKNPASEVHPDPAAVASPTTRLQKGKRDANVVIENQAADCKKQKIVNGDTEQAVENNNLESENQKNTKENDDMASQPDVFPSAAVEKESVDKEEVEVPPAIKAAETTHDAKIVSSPNSENMEDDRNSETLKKDDTKVEMLEALPLEKTPPTPISKTVVMDNLSFLIKEEDVRNFFKDVGEIVEVHFDMKEDYFTGHGRVEFTTIEAAQDALKLNNELLVEQPVKLFLAMERVDEMVEHPTSPVPHPAGSKTLYLGNLSFSVEEDDVRDFFKDVGGIHEIRFAIRDDRFLGYAHVEFVTPEAAQEGLKLNNKEILDRQVRLDLSRERGAYTPGSSVEKISQKGGHIKAKTIFVRGFDSKDGFDNIRNALEKHFGKCGEISRLSIPKDYESGDPKGVAFIDFADHNGWSEALGLDGSEVCGKKISVEEAKNQRGDTRERSGYGGGRGASWHYRESGSGGASWHNRESGSGASWHRESGSSGGGWGRDRGYGGGHHRESGSGASWHNRESGRSREGGSGGGGSGYSSSRVGRFSGSSRRP